MQGGMAMARKKQSVKKEEKSREVSEQELTIAFDGPATAVNKFYITITEMGVRIGFTEQFGEAVKPKFRAAVAMSFTDAQGLADLLHKMLEKHVRRVEVALEELESPDGK